MSRSALFGIDQASELTKLEIGPAIRIPAQDVICLALSLPLLGGHI